ncbi:TIGR02452 family protein [Streptomyces sp. NPDC058372]|uniref:TIGR02452 family protein n=1 Tax=Streptomyces sp. NPDC058372 TaxID=3346464 RepID=UPI00364B8802
MSARLRGIARETQEIVARGGYRAPSGIWRDLSGEIAAARDATRLHGPEPIPVPDSPPAASTAVTVTAESTAAALLRLAAEEGGPVAALNFASARNPGGGYLNGAQAQEEAVCRATALYDCLLRAPGYYAHHREHRDALYSDRVIFSPGVPVFRDDGGALLETPRTAAFLTSPAPNAGVLRRADPVRAAAEVAPALARRAERVVECAAAHGVRRLVLGAWGCGVFQNDPAEVADAFRRLLTAPGARFARTFDTVVLAVLDRSRTAATRAAFEAAFAPERP